MKVLLYGPLAELIEPRVDLDGLDGCTVGQVRERLREVHPEASHQLSRSRALVADAIARDDRTVAAGDSIEFLPPVSGG